MKEKLKILKEKIINDFTGLGIGLSLTPVILVIAASLMSKSPEPNKVTVMITNYSGTSGGSGVVIKNSENKSLVLTNGHVCELVSRAGGLVRHETGDFFVTGTVTSAQHDLCVISVAADLKNSVKIANAPPTLYSEAVVTGHPALLPNIITKGHFGNKQSIKVLVGVKPCAEKDFEGPNNLMCIFFGGIPVVKNFESQIVSALIQSGSSGSAVLNSDGELSGLVFAGAGDSLSYASIVPYEYIISFLYVELPKSRFLIPTNEMVLSADQTRQNKISSIHEANKKCKTVNVAEPKLKEICKILKNDTMYRE